MKTHTRYLLLILFCSLLLTDHIVSARRKRKRRRRKKVTIKTSNIVDGETISINAEARRGGSTKKRKNYKKNTHSRSKFNNVKKPKKKPYTKKNKSKYGKNKTKNTRKTRTVRTSPITDVNHSHYYDHYVFAIQWAKSICSTKRCPYNTNLGQVFNLHGLWPSTNRRKMGPFDCKASRVQWRTVDKALKKELKTHWAGLFGSGPDFNAYEWRKHGTCLDPFHGDVKKMPKLVGPVVQSWRNMVAENAKIANDPNTSRREKRNNSRDPKKAGSSGEKDYSFYFKLSIALNKTLNLKGRLAKEGIKPNPKRFKLKKLQTAVYRAYGIKNFYVRCDRGKGNRRSEFYVSEIRFCYDLNFKIMECKRRFSTTCDDHVFIK